MVFTAWPFPVFLLIVFVVYWGVTADSFRRSWLLLTSYVFYGAWDWRFLGLIWLSTLVDFVAARRMSASTLPAHRKRWLVISLVTNLGVLGFFKYFNFFADSLVILADRFGAGLSVPTLEVILPVGISFYTFQTLSYTIDVYRERLNPVGSLRDFALFVAFFPQLVAGPIVRASDFLPQLERRRRWTDVDWRWAWTLILVGFIKKSCIADHLGVAIDPLFADPSQFDGLSLLLATLMYAAQIFCDFSGYSDIAIGTALLFGYRLPTNFRAPYIATSVIDFWRRWHISLSSWLRDYLYVPMGGSRCSHGRRDLNVMTTMLLGGLWHGAGWNFVAWGCLHGAALVMCRRWSSGRHRMPMVIAWPLTLAWVAACWIPFRCADWSTTVGFLHGLTSNTDGLQLAHSWWWLLAACGLIHWTGGVCELRVWVRRSPGWILALVAGAGWALALSFAQSAERPFIYFQF